MQLVIYYIQVLFGGRHGHPSIRHGLLELCLPTTIKSNLVSRETCTESAISPRL